MATFSVEPTTLANGELMYPYYICIDVTEGRCRVMHLLSKFADLTCKKGISYEAIKFYILAEKLSVKYRLNDKPVNIEGFEKLFEPQILTDGTLGYTYSNYLFRFEGRARVAYLLGLDVKFQNTLDHQDLTFYNLAVKLIDLYKLDPAEFFPTK
jgi:hypothetical protein